MERDNRGRRISRLALADLPAVLAIQREIYPDFLIEDGSSFASRIELPNSYCLAARIEDRMLGYLIAHGWRSNAPPPLGATVPLGGPNEVLYIHDLGVSRSGRDLGIGQALVGHAMALAARDGMREAQLIAVQGAASYWERLGFSEGAALHDLRAKLLSYGMDCLWMTRAIS